jgi:hypothetical protein
MLHPTHRAPVQTLDLTGLPDQHREVLENCLAEAWRNFENGDPEAQTARDVAADVAQQLVSTYDVVTYPREDI